MSTFLAEFKSNIRLTDILLSQLNQGILNPKNPKSVIVWTLQRWPMWYVASWITFYLYLIFGERAGLVNISEQIWCLMTISQVLVKIINHLLQSDKVKDILRWCEGIYTTQYKPEYQVIVESVFQKTNSIIGLCIRVNAFLVGSAVVFYLAQPLIKGNRTTPTPISLNGVTYHPSPVFLSFYFGQLIHAFFVFVAMSGYDAIFIQCIQLATYRFRTMSQLLGLLKNCEAEDVQKQKEILVDMSKMHLDVLSAIELFRSYYFFYGLLQLGSNLFCNCTILYLLKTIGYDIGGISVFLASSTQVFIACAFGQQLQDEAHVFEDALYDTDWINMSVENRRILLLLMTGSMRKVTIRAGGTYELNLNLFAQIMKAGATLCAVMQAV